MYGILVDIIKCSGCEQCVAACIRENHLNIEKAQTDRVKSLDQLSSNILLSIQEVEKDKFARKSCMHCVDPSCVSACLVGGLTKTEAGPVIYDESKCIGCRYCMIACPFEIPKYQWEKQAPLMKKCEMCFDRIADGMQPACVDACPNNALLFDKREKLIDFAKMKIKKGGYINHIYGEKEFGGTSVMYISDVSLEKLGWPKNFDEAIPEITDPLIEKTPVIGLSVASSLIGLNWIIGRRNKLAKQKKVDSNKGEENE